MKSKSTLVAKAALFDGNGKVLMLTRSETDETRPGDYDYPGGRIDHGEGPDEAMIREIQEEIGLEVAIDSLSLVYTDTSFYENKSTIRFLYAGTIGDVSIKLSYEHSKYEWMSVEEVFAKFNHPVWVDGLRYALDHQLI